MRPAIGTEEWQYDRARELLWHGADEREAMVRRLADLATHDHRTYKFGLTFAYLPAAPSFVPIDESPRVVSSHMLRVRLISYLDNRPDAARIVAEEMLRDQIARLT